MPSEGNSKRSALEWLSHPYRLVVKNEDTFEEVFSFRLSRMSVYIALSTVFVLLVMVTVATLVFTPLKYYIPGYGDIRQHREFIQLRMRTDSLEKVVTAKEKYFDNLKQIMNGSFTGKLDTTQLRLPKVDNSTY